MRLRTKIILGTLVLGAIIWYFGTLIQHLQRDVEKKIRGGVEAVKELIEENR